MSEDLTARLRRWSHDVDVPPASDLMDEAADEIERLRLTDQERDAIESACGVFGYGPAAQTLRALLKRLG